MLPVLVFVGIVFIVGGTLIYNTNKSTRIQDDDVQAKEKENVSKDNADVSVEKG